LFTAKTTALALAKRHHGHLGLHPRPLSGEHELAAFEFLSRFGFTTFTTFMGDSPVMVEDRYPGKRGYP